MLIRQQHATTCLLSLALCVGEKTEDDGAAILFSFGCRRYLKQQQATPENGERAGDGNVIDTAVSGQW